jgi:hypothetical protein
MTILLSFRIAFKSGEDNGLVHPLKVFQANERKEPTYLVIDELAEFD